MVRRASFIIGLGLALFWWIGISLDRNATLLWFNAVAAVVAFAIGGLVDDTVEHNPANAFGPGILGLGLAALWIVCIATRQPIWLSWLNFLFAVACLAVAVMALGQRRIELRTRA
ncbi:MAG TPA: hypothetical protein VKQ32_24985 [Polyangia bacterium]|nr:hypothetical protein [Polyangia bacterium]